MDIRFAEFSLPQSGAVVVGVWEERVLTASARRLDEATGGAVARAVAAAPRFHGKKNELLPLIGPPGLPLSRIVLAGFSQGGAIALQAGLRQREPLAALVVLSAYLPLAATAAAEAQPAGRAIPIFMAHGRDDTVIPIDRAQASRDLLAELGCHVQWHEYAIPHSVSEEEIRDLARFLSEALK